jgi:arabinogalactan endo-1,4-beta-galactosidase
MEVMVHIDRGGDNGGSRYFYDHILAQGVSFDVIGLSYYPFWHGSLAALRQNLTDLAGRYGKPLVVAETAYPWTMANGDNLGNLITDPAQLPDGARFPATPTGQAAYFEALRGVLLAVPGGLGAGFLDWEPEWIPGVGWEPGAGNPNDNLTMFDTTGRALPSLASFRAP